MPDPIDHVAKATEIDYAELREKAEKALPDGQYGTYTFDGTRRLREFQSIASPQVVLALLDEIDGLRRANELMALELQKVGYTDKDAADALRERDEALAAIERIRVQAAVPHSAFDDPGNMILPIRSILDAVPADALRKRDAEKWDEGFDRGFYSGQAMPSADASESPVRNPYREEADRG